MRSLFIVISKVYGLMQVYAGLTYIFTVIPMFSILGRDEESSVSTAFHGEQLTLSLISLGAMVVLTLGLAWLLLVRTEWLADKLKIPKSESSSSPSPSVETLLYAGTKLIGLYIVVQGIPLLVQGLFQIRHMPSFGAYMWSTMASPVIRVIIGVLLVMKTRAVVGIIIEKKGQNQKVDHISNIASAV
jgi:hypothetical protein